MAACTVLLFCYSGGTAPVAACEFGAQSRIPFGHLIDPALGLIRRRDGSVATCMGGDPGTLDAGRRRRGPVAVCGHAGASSVVA